MIEFICCGETNYVKSIDDCNLVGDFKIILNILNKCLVYKDHMEDHVYKPGKSKTNDDTWYLPFRGIITQHSFYSEVDYIPTKNGIYYGSYITPCCHKSRNEISKNISYTKAGNLDPLIYSNSKSYLENWKYFVFNNKLPLFINICLIISQNNVVKPYIPFIVDKQYTDEEIYTLLNISPVEQQFIDNTLKKYERNSKWFKRYMCGKNIK